MPDASFYHSVLLYYVLELLGGQSAVSRTATVPRAATVLPSRGGPAHGTPLWSEALPSFSAGRGTVGDTQVLPICRTQSPQVQHQFQSQPE